MIFIQNVIINVSFWLNDIAAPLVILACIRAMYMMFLSQEACLFIENQFAIFSASSISCITVLELYYQFLQINNIDDKGFILTCFLTAGGLFCNLLNEKYFKKRNSGYLATDEEYLFIVTIVFISISTKMVLRGILHWMIPLALLLGRFFWLDTKSLKSIFSMLRVDHARLIETSSIYLVGMVLSTLLATNLKYKYLSDFSWSCIYGLLVLPVYLCLRKLLHRMKMNNFTR